MSKKIISVILFFSMIFMIVPAMAQTEEAQEVLERINSSARPELMNIIDQYHYIIFNDESVYVKYMDLSGANKSNIIKNLYSRIPFDHLENFSDLITILTLNAYSTSAPGVSGGGSGGGGGEPADSIGITLSEASGKSGEIVEITLDITGNTGFVNLGLEISYDSSVLTLLSVSENEEVSAICTTAESIDTNPYNIVWDSDSDVDFNGTLATFTFKIADNAPTGDYPVDVNFYRGRDGDYVDGDDVNYNGDENPIILNYVCGKINVYTHIPGDIDGDGEVNNKDATYLLRYLAGWNIEGINEEALDTTGDGRITNKDGTRLLRYLADWDVEIH